MSEIFCYSYRTFLRFRKCEICGKKDGDLTKMVKEIDVSSGSITEITVFHQSCLKTAAENVINFPENYPNKIVEKLWKILELIIDYKDQGAKKEKRRRIQLEQIKEMKRYIDLKAV